MKRIQLLIAVLTLTVISQLSFGQGQSQQFKMVGINPETISINQTFTSDTEIFPFKQIVNQIFGLAVSAKIVFKSDKSVVRLLFVDKNYEEYLIYEAYPLLEPTEQFSVEKICEETSVLNGVQAYSVKIEIVDAQITIKSLTYTKAVGQGVNKEQVRKDKKQGQNEEKIKKINKNLEDKGMNWIAGPTKVSELTFAERKKLYGQGKFPEGFEYYSGGVISAGSSEQLKSATASSPYVDNWDWRNRHGKNWITPVTHQITCGSCWAFASTGATEAMVNVFFNQIINLNLSEQDVLSCSGGGSCSGGYPSTALDYITNTGIVDEAAFPYSGTDQNCLDKGKNPSEMIKIGGKVDFGSTSYPKTEDDLKRMLIQMGPVSGGLYDWSHAMVLVGYKIVKEGDKFYLRDALTSRSDRTVEAGDPLIGKTVWIFKNSWGTGFGDYGYIHVETPITNMGWTHGIKTPITSVIKNYQVICEDRDGDGYFWWGLGPKPATCATCPSTPDGNDADATLGPLDQYGNCTVIGGSPLANFTSTKTIITKGETVTFTDLSTNTPTSWSWSFAGGTPSTSTAKNPAVSYATAGTYQVILTATNSAGSNTKTVTNYIQVNEPVLAPVANFSASKTVITKGETVTFTDLSTNTPTSWSWSFTGGTPSTSTAKNPAVSYATAGTYQVNLTATNSAGSNTKTVTSYIQVNEPVLAPVANFSASKTVINKGETVTFTDLSTNTPTSWSWSFAGGTPSTSTAKNPAVNYATAGTYQVILTATNSAGSNTKTVTNYIQVNEPVLAPVAEFVAAKTTVVTGEQVQFNDLSQNEPTQWEWSFPGGTPAVSTVKNPFVTYNTSGEYDVTLTVSKPGTVSSKKVKLKYIVTIENKPADYCVPVAISSSPDFISSVVIGNVLTSNSTGSGYSLAGNLVSMAPGKSYSVTLTPKVTSNRNFWKIWIDFNGDYDFNDAGENVVTVSNKKGAAKTSFTVPQYATGITRMRIAMRNQVLPAECDDNYKGEVEDYSVTFGAAAQLTKSATPDLQDEVSTNLRVYPNPVNQLLNVQLDMAKPGDFYTIYNINGGKVVSNQIISTHTTIDFEGYSPGIYLLRVINGDRVFNERIIKK